MTATITVEGRSISWTDGTWSGDETVLRFVREAAVGEIVETTPVGPAMAVTLEHPVTVLAYFDAGPYEVTWSGDWPDPPWENDPQTIY